MSFNITRHLVALGICGAFLGCTRLDDPQGTIDEDLSPISILSIKKVSDGIDNSYNGQAGQGFAIHGQVAYRFYNTGICQTYDIKDIEAPIKLSSFPLRSFRANNHSNCAQFASNSEGTPLLYVSGLSGKCYVERMRPDGSELIQTLTLPSMEAYNISTTMNIICGDDGYLWAFGSALTNNALSFVKLRRPDVAEGDIPFTAEDILDYWTEENYIYSSSVWQGGMVYDGLLYFVFGTQGSNRHIAVYDTATRQKIHDIDLNKDVSEEPEDCDLVDGIIILTINGGNGYYVINLEKK